MMKEKNIIFFNGSFMPKEEAKISVFDRGFIFGDGIYEVVPIYEGVMVDKEEFWARFERSLEAIELRLPYERAEFEGFLRELIAKNGVKFGGVYMQLSRGVASRDFAFIKGLAPTIMAFVYEEEILPSPGAISVISTTDLRWKRRDIKSISLLAQCLAKNKASKAGADEAFMIENGFVTEASSASAFIIKDATLYTKPFSNEILPGIRRLNILKFAKELGLKVCERAFDMSEVYDADEVFISAASLPILAVIRADERLINGGIIGSYTKALHQRYIEKMRAEARLG